MQTRETEEWINRNFNCKKTLVIANSIRDLPHPKKQRNKSIQLLTFTLKRDLISL